MPISVSNQAYVFLWSVLGGMLIAFIYDLFRIKRKAIRTVNLLTHLEDFTYWILVALVMFGVVYYSNEGEIRGYIFIGTILGAVLYTLLLSRIVTGAFLFVLGIIKKVISTVWKVVSFPFKLLFKLLSGPAKLLSKLLRSLFKGAKRAGRHNLSKAAVLGRRFKNIIKKI